MKKHLEVIQEESSDCGICSLASIIKYYKGDISLETLRFMTNTNSNGCNALELINCAKTLGFNAYGEKCEILKTINQPLIAHLKLENNLFHFVVVYKIGKKYLIIMDPSRGFIKLTNEDFYKLFTGVIINLIPINNIPKYKKSKFIQNRLIKELTNNKKSYITILIVSILILIFTIINNFEVKLLNYKYNTIYLLLFIMVFNEILIYLKNIL